MEIKIPWSDILNTAKNAPSGGNMQPWAIELNKNSVCIKPDIEKEKHNYYYMYLASLFSVGALSFNIKLAAESLGFATNITFNDSPQNICIDITPLQNSVINHEMLDAIRKRCTNRKPTVNTIPKSILLSIENKFNTLISEHNFPCLKILRIREKVKLKRIAQILSQLEKLRISNSQKKESLFSELKCDEGDFPHKISLNTLDLPFGLKNAMCAMIKAPALRELLLPSVVQAIVKTQLIKSSDIACIYGADNFNEPHMLQAGYAFQYYWVQLTLKGYSLQPWASLSFFNFEHYYSSQNIFSSDEVDLIKKLIDDMGSTFNETNKIPLVIFRLSDAPLLNIAPIKRI